MSEVTVNLFAYTAPGSVYPEFISVNVDKPAGTVTVHVRSPANADGTCGTTASVMLPRDVYLKLIEEGAKAGL